MNICQKLTTVIAVSILLTAIEAKQVRADLVTDQFTVTVSSGSLAGQQGNGSFSYDNSLETGSGLETLQVDSLEFNFLGNVYSDTDDYFSAQGFPTLDLNNGNLVGLNYTVEYSPNQFFNISGSPNLYDSTGGINFYEGVPDNSNNLALAGTTTYTTATGTPNSVPEPTGLLGMLALVVLGIKSRMLRQQ